MTPLIIANWKMHATIDETVKLLTEIRFSLNNPDGVEVVFAPPFTALYSAHIALQETNFKLAAQDLFWELEGPYTGEIAGSFLKDVGCHYVIVAHSERRRSFGETDEIANKKVRAALTQDLIPILCIGETDAERKSNQTMEVLQKQLKRDLQEIAMSDLKNFVVAYEPVWAIGTGNNATVEQVEEVHSFIRNTLAKMYDAPTASRIRIIYGGSVKGDNAFSLLHTKNVDGLLVGGASLIPEQFIKICQSKES
ncbi:MAG: triose-phosphate isomerase [Deltaproteobacteria bacterium]|nr:triose-phosphate isomerase [Deltaproteobacteria bacterium]